jgi:hypothetical protein
MESSTQLKILSVCGYDSGYNPTQGSTKLKHLVIQVSIFRTVVPNIFSIITALVAYKNAHKFPCIEIR